MSMWTVAYSVYYFIKKVNFNSMPASRSMEIILTLDLELFFLNFWLKEINPYLLANILLSGLGKSAYFFSDSNLGAGNLKTTPFILTSFGCLRK